MLFDLNSMGKKKKCRRANDHDYPFYLPEDYLIQVLVRLPVLSLLRFKSVCKSWLTLIQSFFFIDLHTTSTSNSSKFGTFILSALQYHQRSLTPMTEFLVLSSEEYELYGDWYWGADGTWHKLTSTGNNHQVFKWANDDQLVLKLDYLGFPQIPSLDKLTQSIVGSCNGLICLYDPYLKAVSLWNPATRQFRRLPKSITMEKGVDYVLFSFDVETKDYKVLMITYPGETCGQQLEEEYSCRAQVYSLSTDSWRLLEGINSLSGLPFFGHDGVYLNNGTCYFMANASYPERKLYTNRFIVSYDFTKEIFTTMQFPDHDDRRHLFLCCLGNGEKIALFTTLQKTTSSSGSEEYHGSQDCDIWVLNEHGGGGSNKESWNKLHSFQINNIMVGALTILRGISNDGKFALIETKDSYGYERMLLYNLVTKEAIKDLLICGRLLEVHVFKPSLVSIVGGNGAAAAAAAPAIE